MIPAGTHRQVPEEEEVVEDVLVEDQWIEQKAVEQWMAWSWSLSPLPSKTLSASA